MSTSDIPNQPDRTLALYRSLARCANRLALDVPAQHEYLFDVSNPAYERYYRDLYVDQLGGPAKPPPADSRCAYCSPFHLDNLKAINKSADIGLGTRLEDTFFGFLKVWLAKYEPGYECKKAAEKDHHYPDFAVHERTSGRPLCYFEFKVIFRPYILIAKKLNKPEYCCYSHSLTLDHSNGKKLAEQRSRVENDIGVDRVAYVYWYDIPCVKGIFWMPASRVYEQMDRQAPGAYERKLTPGDFSPGGIKIGSTKKLYLTLLEMNDFASLLDFLTIADGEDGHT